jgi:hypothetical protein
MISQLNIAGIEPGQFYFSDVLPLKEAVRYLLSAHPSEKIPLSGLNELTHALTYSLGAPYNML